MKKNVRRLLIALLSLTVMFAMGSFVFADDDAAAFDNSTAFADGDYAVAYEGGTAKVKLTCGMLHVQNGKVTADFETSSGKQEAVYVGNLEENAGEPSTIEGTVSIVDKKFTIPADLSKPMIISVYTTAMSSSKWTHYTLDLSEVKAKTALEITNDTGMFKAVSARIETLGTSSTLVMALSGTGYANLFKGTFAEAVANGDNRDNWIKGYTNADGKVEFAIPLEEGETYMPLVAISQSYLGKYESGQNDLERAFFPRQAEIDYNAKTLVTGDYEQTIELTVENRVSMFKPGNVADLKIVGGPNSNNYSTQLTLHMGSDSFSKVKATEFSNYAGTITEKGEVTVDLADGNKFEAIPVLPGMALKLQFFSKSKEQWYDRYLYVDELNRTVTFTAPIEDATIDAIPAQTYTGKALTPAVTVRKGDTTLVKDTDYTVEYSKNKNAGEAKVTITGIGNFSGTKDAGFTINKAKNPMTVKAQNKTLKVKALKKKAVSYTAITVKNAKEKVTYKATTANTKSKKALKFNQKNGKITVAKKTKKGTYKMTITVTSGGTNYVKSTKAKTVKVVVK